VYRFPIANFYLYHAIYDLPKEMKTVLKRKNRFLPEGKEPVKEE
jgi:hypothetical protein